MMFTAGSTTHATQKLSKELISTNCCTQMDTLILTKNFASANQYLHLIEEESQYLDLNLNKSKCCCVAFNCRDFIAFQNGDPMKSTDESTYLGASITRTVGPKHEIRRRISATMAILKNWTFLGKNAMQQILETARFQRSNY